MFSKTHFSDLDEMLESLVGWNLDFLPLEKGRFPSRIGQYLFEDTYIGEAYFYKRVEQRGSTPSGYRTFVIPKDDSVNYHWRGKEIDGQTLSLFPPDGELYSVSNGSFRVFTLSISFRLLEKALGMVRSIKVEGWLKAEQVWKVSSIRMQRIRELVRKLVTTGTETRDFRSRELELELALEILNSMDLNNSSKIGNRNKRDGALVKCLELIRAVPRDGILSLSDLCKESLVSERTLQYAFKDRFGLTPKEYMKNYNLRMVKNRLDQGLQHTKIRDVAGEFGFWHMGQFASDYKRHFGELPSESMRSAKQL